MPPSDPQQAAGRRTGARLALVLALTALFGLWLAQDSLSAYWQEHYYRAYPLAWLERFALWRSGSLLHDRAAARWADNDIAWFYRYLFVRYEAFRKRGDEPVAAGPERPGLVADVRPGAAAGAGDSPPAAPVPAASPGLRPVSSPAALSRLEPERPHSGDAEPMIRPEDPARPPCILHSGAAVFFGGDSLMEGVAPHVAHWLFRQGIASCNKSHRSTGLSYPNKVRDWPLEVERSLEGNPQIRLVIMFLGPNDPWDFPDPEEPRGKFLRFRSAAWEKVYRERISRILTAAEQHQARVIWLGLPYMRQPQFDQQMSYLDEVMRSETAGRALFLPTRDLLSSTGAYSDDMPLGGRAVTVRARDGVHFSPRGQRILAQAIQQQIHILPKEPQDQHL